MAIRTRKGKRRNREAGSRDARGRIRGRIRGKVNKTNRIKRGRTPAVQIGICTAGVYRIIFPG
jgi:hypothetical protein